MDPAELKSDASAALAAGDFARAGSLYAAYCAGAPGDRQSFLRMGDAWSRAGDRPRAIDAYLAAAQGFAADGFLARAIAASKLVLELEPGHQRMQRILADLYTQRGVGPGIGRRPRPPPEVELPPPVERTRPAPAPAASADDEAPELTVTEFVLDTPLAERSLEDVLAEAMTAPATASEEGDGTPDAALDLTPVSPPPDDDVGAPATPTDSARFHELSLDDAELTMPAPPAPPPVTTPRPASFSLAEPGPRPVPPPAEPPVLYPVGPPPEVDTEAASEPASSPAEEGRYVELFFDDDEPLEPATGEPLAASISSLPDETLGSELPEDLVVPAEAVARSVPRAPLFSDLSSEAFVELVERCPLRQFAAGERILQQDAPGDAFYVICEGQVSVRREEGGQVVQLASLSEGDFFGEMALLSGAPRVASVDAVANGTLVLEISTALLTELTRRHPGVALALKKFCRQRLVGNLMATAALFRPLSRADRRALASSFRARDVLAGDTVIVEGERGDGLYLILAGLLEVSRGGFRIAKLTQGEVFGETSLLGRRPAVATVRALQRTSLLRLPEDDFARVADRYPAVRAHLEALRDARARENARLPLDPGEDAALLV